MRRTKYRSNARRKKTRRRTRLYVLLFMMAALLLLALLLPLKPWAAQLLRHELGQRGIAVEALTVAGLGLHGLKFEQVKISAPYALEVPKMGLNFSWQAIRQRRWADAVSSVQLESVIVSLEQNAEGKWLLNGLLLPEPAEPQPKSAPETMQHALDATLANFAQFPAVDAKNIDLTVKQPKQLLHAMVSAQSEKLPDGVHLAISAEQPNLTLEGQGSLSLPHFVSDVVYHTKTEGPTMHLMLSFAATQWQSPGLNAGFDGEAKLDVVGQEKPTTQLVLKQVHLEQGALKANIPEFSIQGTGGGISAKAAKDWFPWAMRAEAKSIQLEGVPAQVAQLAFEAKCTAAATSASCERLHLATPDKNIDLSGNMNLAYASPEKFGWKAQGEMKQLLGGQASFTATPVKDGLQPLKATLNVNKLGLEAVLSLMAEGKVKATGTVSGTVPVTWSGGTNIVFGTGELKADAPGSIQLAPELLAMDNPQVAMVSGILADFQFSDLKILLGAGAKGGLKVGLSTLGHNPAQLEGHSVKLNVNLSGDLLSLLQQSILPMSDPQQWLKNQESSPH